MNAWLNELLKLIYSLALSLYEGIVFYEYGPSSNKVLFSRDRASEVVDNKKGLRRDPYILIHTSNLLRISNPNKASELCYERYDVGGEWLFL